MLFSAYHIITLSTLRLFAVAGDDHVHSSSSKHAK